MRHRTIAGILGLGLGLATLATLASVSAEPSRMGGGIVARSVVGGLNGPAAFTFLPDGRIVYLERGSGEVHIYDRQTNIDHRFYKVPGVNGDGERGALGVAVSPDWPESRTLYVYATRSSGAGLKNQIVKVTRASGHVSMRVLMTTPASSSPYHNGGRILFGADGMLYAIVGEGHDSSNAQDLTGNLRGKLLRMTPSGSVPPDNPIAGSRIYAFGIRNSYGFAFDPQTDRLWESENGPECMDEMNLIVAGGNFGWGPNENCGGVPGGTNNSGPTPRHLPKLWFVSTIGITGAAFCQDCGLTEEVEGQLFFGGVNDGLLRRVALNAARNDVSGGPVQVLESPNGAIYSMEAAPDGRIYFSDSQGIYRLAPA
jgi:glucose/arabinose dehydrogenase